MSIRTPLTELLGIKHPVLLAGMNQASGAKLAAAVSNAGGCGAIGGLTLSPKMLRQVLEDLRSQLDNQALPFGVDLALPQVGGGARKTNHDYTHGKLDELIDVIIEFKTTYFICAVGVPPRHVVERLHAAGILVANMVGAPKHAEKAIAAGADLIICQGTEGGGHTGEIGTMSLVGQCVEVCKGKTSELNGRPIYVVAAGGITNGTHLAAALALGAVGVWVGTRFVASEESAAPDRHKQLVVQARALDTLRTLVVSGRPLRTFRTPYIDAWETQRREEIQALCDRGIVPMAHDMEQKRKQGEEISIAHVFPMLMGQSAGSIHSILPARVIIESMVREATQVMQASVNMVSKL